MGQSPGHLKLLFIARPKSRRREIGAECNEGEGEGDREGDREGERGRQKRCETEMERAGRTPEDYQADLQLLCPPGKLDQRLDQVQWST